MADWCLYGEATDADGESYAMAPDIVIINVPDKTVLNRKNLFHFLKNQVGKKGLKILTRKTVSRKYWGTMKLYSRWGRILTRLGFYQQYYQDYLTLISLTGEVPEDLKKGFLTFGKGFLVRFYDWTGRNDEDQMKKEFTVRHPGLMGSFK